MANSEWQYWNNEGKEKKFTIPFDIEKFQEYVPKDAFIFDYGCGYGRVMEVLEKSGYHKFAGCDYSFPMLLKAKNISCDISLVQNNNIEIPFKNSVFDAVLIVAVLTCIIDNKQQSSLIKEISRILKPGGCIFIADFLLNSDERNIQRYEKFKNNYDSYGVFELDNGVPLRHHDEKCIEHLLKDFIKIEFEKKVFNTMNGHTSNGFYYIGKVNK